MSSSRLTVITSGLLAVVLAMATVVAWGGGRTVPAGPSLDGPAIFQTRGCAGCHTIQGVSATASIGPDLTKLSERAADRVAGLDARAYVAESVRSPQAFIAPGYTSIMPTFEFTDEELDILVDFLLTDR